MPGTMLWYSTPWSADTARRWIRGLRFIEGSVGDSAVLDLALRGCDAVLHLAGYIEVAESQRDPARYFRGNVTAPLVMLDSLVRHSVGAVVFSSTAAVYGEPKSVPIQEDADLLPVNAYGASKLMFEQCLDWYGRAYGLRSIRLRYFNVAGAWPDGSLGEAHDPETHIIPRILRSIVGGERRFELYGSDYPTHDGTCVRDYIHVCDLALAHRLALETVAEQKAVDHADLPYTAVYNLGNGMGFTNLEVVRACAAVAGEDVEIVGLSAPRGRSCSARSVRGAGALRIGMVSATSGPRRDGCGRLAMALCASEWIPGHRGYVAAGCTLEYPSLPRQPG